jgi:hypothetical protein
MKKLAYLIFSLLAISYLTAYAQIPDVQRSGEISFVSGGIGSNESEAIQAEAKKWPLLLQFSQADQKGWGTWVSGVSVKITNDKKEKILNLICDGPFLLLGLKPGSYVIEASYEGITQQRNVMVRQGQSEKLSIYWR